MNRMNVIRNLSLSLLLTASVFAAPAYAQVSVNINVGPPALQYEAVPVMAPGYVWAPGYWGWSGDRHVWIRGRSIVQRAGYRWEPDRWDQRNSSYYRTAGHWERDSGYRAVKVKQEKQFTNRDNGDRGNRGEGNRGEGNNGNHGHGNNGKHGRGN